MPHEVSSCHRRTTRVSVHRFRLTYDGHHTCRSPVNHESIQTTRFIKSVFLQSEQINVGSPHNLSQSPRWEPQYIFGDGADGPDRGGFMGGGFDGARSFLKNTISLRRLGDSLRRHGHTLYVYWKRFLSGVFQWSDRCRWYDSIAVSFVDSNKFYQHWVVFS